MQPCKELTPHSCDCSSTWKPGEQSRVATTSPAGEAAFHVLAEVDSGGGFEDLVDLGIVTTGPSLLVPDDRLINGNEDAYRTQVRQWMD